MGHLLKVIRFAFLIYKLLRLAGRAGRLSRRGPASDGGTPIALRPAPAARPSVSVSGAIVAPLAFVALAVGSIATFSLAQRPPAPASPEPQRVASAVPPPERDVSVLPGLVPAAATIPAAPPDVEPKAAPTPPQRPAALLPVPPPVAVPEPIAAPEPTVTRHTSIRLPLRRGRGGCGSRGGAGYRLPNGRCASRRR